VLKRRADAERDGDRIYAVIDAVGGSSDGRHLGLTAPRKEGQQLAVRRAYEQAGYGPDRVGLVEAHGTGTVVGDRTELATLTETFTDHGAGLGAAVLGSVKSQVGHTKCAAGVVGLVKIARSVYHGVLPPTLHLEQPQRGWDGSSSPFRFLSSAQPWPASERHAAVSAFGFGGTNFHAVISSTPGADSPSHGVGPWPAELVLLRGATRAEAQKRAATLADVAAQVAAADPTGQRHRLRDLAYTVSVGHDTGPVGDRAAVQIAVVARSWDDLAARLRAAAAGEEDRSGVFLASPGPEEGPEGVAFVYPGQGSQRPNMLAELFVAFPWLNSTLDAGRAWLAPMFPPAAHTSDERAAQIAEITATGNAQPALGIAEAALTAIWARLGLRPDAAAGHSYGELAALAAAGCFDLPTLLAISAARAAAMTEAAAALGDDAGTMAAVSLGGRELADLLDPTAGVVIANLNSPRQSVISGPTAAVTAAVASLAAQDVGTRPLSVACAFHSPLVSEGAARFHGDLQQTPWQSPTIPVIAGASAAAYPDDPDAARALLAQGIASPVRWVEQVEALYASGVRTFVEVGPGRVLTHLVETVLKDRPHLAVASDVAGEHGITRLLLACARLAAAGTPVDPRVLFDGRAQTVDVDRLPLPHPGWTVDGHLVRQADGAVVTGALQPADTVPTIATVAPAGTGLGMGDDEARETTVLGYLQSMQAAISAQRDVMLRYLGDTTPSPADLGPAAPSQGAPISARAAKGTETRALDTTPVGAATSETPSETPSEAAAVTAAASGGRWAALDVSGLLLEIVSERTGYPPSMLDADADLEADLSIDSIKRLEILSELLGRVGLGAAGGDDSLIEEVTRIKTLGGIVAWIAAHQGNDLDLDAGIPAAVEGAVDAAEAGTAAQPATTSFASPTPAAPIGRYTLEPVELPAPIASLSMLGRRAAIVVHEGSPTAVALAEQMTAAGASVVVARLGSASQAPDVVALDLVRQVEVVVYLGALEPGAEGDARASFAMWQAAGGGTATRWVAVTVDGGLTAELGGLPAAGQPVRRPTGLAGLLKVAALEQTGLTTRTVDLDGGLVTLDPAVAAERVLAEIEDPEGPVDVAWSDQRRTTHTLRLTAVPGTPDAAGLAMLESHSDEPWPEGSVEGLGPDSVVVLTGGARGITAAVAKGLYDRFGARIELIGRSSLDVAEDPRLDHAHDLNALRRRMAETTQGAQPSWIDATARAVLARREARATLEALAVAGAQVRYHSVDVADRSAVTAVMEDVYRRHGRIDAVIHGAGIIDDRLMADKDPERFAAVYATKVDAARAILDALRPGPVLVALFASVSGVFGNRGQADYAAANAALDALARCYDHRDGRRVVAIDWGPWSGAGMVTDSLARDYQRRGVELVDLDGGVAVMLDVLEHPAATPGQLVVMAGPGPLAWSSPEGVIAGPVTAGPVTAEPVAEPVEAYGRTRLEAARIG
jgi:malonyl CoA-acyl carrier protein transacylase/NAD(P)-dependent dehydrogenase (short-subunit alcohol dehydrogenase family)